MKKILLSREVTQVFFQKIFEVFDDTYRRITFFISDKEKNRYSVSAYQMGSGSNVNAIRIDLKRV